MHETSSVGQRLYGLVIVFSVILIAVGAGAENAADTLAGLKTVYEDRTVAWANWRRL